MRIIEGCGVDADLGREFGAAEQQVAAAVAAELALCES